jgi:hypothetical protein
MAIEYGALPEEAKMADDRDVPHLIPPIDSIEDVLIEVVPPEAVLRK